MSQALAAAGLADSFHRFCSLTSSSSKVNTKSEKRAPIFPRLPLEKSCGDENLPPVATPPKVVKSSSLNIYTGKKMTKVQELALILGSEDPEPDVGTTAEEMKALASAFGYAYDPKALTFQLSATFAVPAKLFTRAFPYQRHAIKWMWDLFTNTDGITGGVLGDDMGLGKTFQVTSFITGLLHGGAARTALIIVPVSLIPTWEQEIKSWMPGVPLLTLHGPSTTKRTRVLDSIKSSGGIVITTYGTLVTQAKQLTEGVRWELLVLDEANKVKNPGTQAANAADAVQAHMKLLLTGTPIQNNLDELWSLFNIACSGKLLGSRVEFNRKFGNAILAAQDRHATSTQREFGDKAMERLKELMSPFFLRREKTVQTSKPASAAPSTEPESNPVTAGATTGEVLGVPTRKVEVIVWTQLTDIQLALYQGFLQSPEVMAVLNETQSPLAALTVLKKISCHPLLLNDRARKATVAALKAPSTVAGEPPDFDAAATSEPNRNILQLSDAIMKQLEGGQAAFQSYAAPTPETVAQLLGMSGKLQFLMTLLESFQESDNRVLVFSQSKVMLDIIQCLLLYSSIRFERIDGSVKSTDDRQATVNRFNTTPDIRVCLLTTGVGAYGLTLTGADRVVIMDPSWNPAVDAQAVDRAYRIGQRKDVVTYRFITCGTIEEKMYRLQVFKGGLTRAVMTAKNQHRYLTRKDTKAMFTLGDTRAPETREIFLESLGQDVFLSRGVACPDMPTDVSLHLEALIAELRNVEISQHDRLFQLASTGQAPAPFTGKAKQARGSKSAAALPKPMSESDDSDYEFTSPAAEDESVGSEHNSSTGEIEDSESEEASDNSLIESESEAELSPVVCKPISKRAEPKTVASSARTASRRVVFDSDSEDDEPALAAPSIITPPASNGPPMITSSSSSPPPPTRSLISCGPHTAAVTAAGFVCFTCRCGLSVEDMDEYNSLLETGLAARDAGVRSKRAPTLKRALGLLMDAIGICSDDPRLHSTIVELNAALRA